MPPTESTEEKQCRICLDGVDAEPELGRLIRPCLCRGSISVCYCHLVCTQMSRPDTRLVRPRQMPAAMEKYVLFKNRILLLPTMSLSIPIRENTGTGPCYQPK